MISSININVQPSKNISPEGAEINFEVSPKLLSTTGFVFPITLQTPSFLCAPPFSRPHRAVTVMALLDTGATRTCISEIVADALELSPVGFSKAYTASGIEEFADYAVDISFPDAGLRSFEDLNVGSCHLPYKHSIPDNLRMAYTNIGALLGRDVMSRWNIFWNGPSSSVFISE